MNVYGGSWTWRRRVRRSLGQPRVKRGGRDVIAVLAIAGQFYLVAVWPLWYLPIAALLVFNSVSRLTKGRI